MQALYKLIKVMGSGTGEMMVPSIKSDPKTENLPAEILVDFKKIKEEDCFLFKEVVDPEHVSSKYLNSINQFRYEFMVSQFVFTSILCRGVSRCRMCLKRRF